MAQIPLLLCLLKTADDFLFHLRPLQPEGERQLTVQPFFRLSQISLIHRGKFPALGHPLSPFEIKSLHHADPLPAVTCFHDLFILFFPELLIGDPDLFNIRNLLQQGFRLLAGQDLPDIYFIVVHRRVDLALPCTQRLKHIIQAVPVASGDVQMGHILYETGAVVPVNDLFALLKHFPHSFV